jgi:hypothetical protein
MMPAPIDFGDLLEVTALEARAHLTRLEAERNLALRAGIAANGTYMSDLEAERESCGRLYAALAVTEIATLRAELFGPQSG